MKRRPDIADNGRIYLYAPDGMAFRSCQSQAIASGGWSLPHRPSAQEIHEAYMFFLGELAEGFEPA